MDLFIYCYILENLNYSFSKLIEYNPFLKYYSNVLVPNKERFNCSNMNPCLSGPCNKIDYAIKDSCKSNGIFINSFSCECISNEFKWSNGIKKCIPLNKCKYKTFGLKHPCGGIGRSISCKFINHQRYECKCKSGWMGDDCNVQYDMCFKSINLDFLIFIL
jgi:hypothetical protein